MVMLVFTSCTTPAKKLRIVGYLPLWESAEWDSIDYSALTHCILSFATFNDDTVHFDANENAVRKLVKTCRDNSVRPMVAFGGFGGFNTTGNPFSTPDKRSNIIVQLNNIVNKYDLDGIDIDIEIKENDPIWRNFDSFVSELRQNLGDDKLLTMAVGMWFTDSVACKTYQRLDFINMMCYDNAFGDADVAPYDMALDFINYYSDRGLKPQQMNIGVPFYGYSAGGVTRDWSEIITLDTLNANRDHDTINAIYFNGLPTLQRKIQLAKKYGGIMIWQLAEDDYNGMSLLQIIKNNINKPQKEE